MLSELLGFISSRNPFRLRYWVVHHNSHGGMLVIRKRLYPGNERASRRYGVITLDGPFDTTDDAARSLAFWIRQYTNAKRPKQRA